MDVEEFLWRMYNEHTTQGRHHEVQRTAVSTVVLALAGAVVAFVSQTVNSLQAVWPIAVFLIVLGAYGALFSLKQAERTRLHITVADAYRKSLEDHLVSAGGQAIRHLNSNARKLHNRKWNWRSGRDDRSIGGQGEQEADDPRSPLFPLYWFFILLNALVAVVGVLILTIMRG
jgi:hypothetical protein